MLKRNLFDIKQLIFFGLFAMPVIALVQSKKHFFKKMELKGDVTIAGSVPFSIAGWFSGEYQDAKEKHLNDVFGFRDLCVRINNQVEFSLFKKINANSVILGKDNYLFEYNYIKAYFGTDFIGEDKIRERSERIRFIQDTLAKLNKTLMIVFAPSKVSFYPEYIPDSCWKPRGKTNYGYYVKYANALKINYIDFNRYFRENKFRSKYPLYPQYGVHWSYYGTCLATDSLIKYIEYKRHIKMPHIYWDRIVVQNKASYYDYDIADGMNLLFKFKSKPMAYPRVQFQPDVGKTKPSLLVVADSHYWGIEELGISNAFSQNDFWYYNREIYSARFHGLVTPAQLDLKKEIASHDVFIIMATESTISNIGWGFIENLYNHFKGYDARIPHFNEMVAKKKAYIVTDQKWMGLIKTKAHERQISEDSMMTLDAIWVIEQDYKKQIAWQREAIKNDPKWMELIRQKAQERRISIDSMITEDAIWVTDNTKK